MWLLTIIFACAACQPPTVIMPQTYASQAQCQLAGALWLTPNANPQHAVRAAVCKKQS